MKNVPLFYIMKTGQSDPILVGPRDKIEQCLKILRSSFYFVAGNGKPIVDEFPYSISPAR